MSGCRSNLESLSAAFRNAFIALAESISDLLMLGEAALSERMSLMMPDSVRCACVPSLMGLKLDLKSAGKNAVIRHTSDSFHFTAVRNYTVATQGRRLFFLRQTVSSIPRMETCCLKYCMRKVLQPNGFYVSAPSTQPQSLAFNTWK